MSPRHRLQLKVNGEEHALDVDPSTPLLLVLRNALGLTAAKAGCGLEQCGACAVLVDGVATLSCATPAGAFAGRAIVTAEGLGAPGRPSLVQQAFVDEGAGQCGYCIPGLVVAVTALLDVVPEPEEPAVRAALAPHLCRCGSHPRVLRAVRRAAAVLAGEEPRERSPERALRKAPEPSGETPRDGSREQQSGTASLDSHPMVDQWIRFAPDGTVLVHGGKVEIGQRISTAYAAIAAAELNLAPSRVRLAPVTTDGSPDEGMTSGSNSIEHSGEAVRLAAATARRHLLALAAAALGVEGESLELAEGLVRERCGNRSASVAELLPDGRLRIAVDTAPGDPPAALEAGAFAALRAARAGALATGAERFLHDRRAEGLLHARVVRPPHAGARLVAVDGSAAGAGVHLVREGSFLAVAAEDEHAAMRAAARVAGAARWEEGAGLDGGDVFERLRANPRRSLAVVEGTPRDGAVPPPPPFPADAVFTLQARYERPYQMHGALGPSVAMARMSDGGLEVWSHSQGIYPLRDSLAEALGMPADRVRLEHVPGAGCYGHNGADDAALDAALVARALPGRAVLLTWSREDEHAWEPYGSAMAVQMRGAVGAAGRVSAWSHESYSDTHLGRPRPGAGAIGPARLLATRWLPDPPPPFVPAPQRGTHTGIHRNADPLYDFPRKRVVKHLVHGLPLRTSALRTLGGFANVFAIECFLDELAHGAGLDPLAFRLAHLGDPRARAVLEQAARMIADPPADPRTDPLGDPPAGAPGTGDAGLGRGLAFARYKNRQAWVAVAVTLRVDDAARVRLERAAIAADAGRVVDVDGLAAQLEGGFLQAASWTLHEQVRHDAGGVLSRDWASYPVLRFDEVPEIEVAVLERPGEPPLGAGEAACGPAGAAIANAVFDATGLRLRRLPLTPEALREAALA